jgi:hypothetical protein
MNKRESIVFIVGTLLVLIFIGTLFYNITKPKNPKNTETQICDDSTFMNKLGKLENNDSIIIMNQRKIDRKLDNVRTIKVFKVKKIQNDTVTLKPLE